MGTRQDERNADILWNLILWLIVVPLLIRFIIYLFQ